MIPSTSVERRLQCCVCGSYGSVGFNYGACLCNACKQFVRRYSNDSTQLVCDKNFKCFTRRCRLCRYNKCVSVGVNCFQTRPSLLPDEKTPRLLTNLKAMNEKRSECFLNSQPTEDIIPEDVIGRKRATFCLRTKKNMTAHDWANLQMITTIEFMKNFHFVSSLTDQDVNIFIKRTYFNCGVFFMAMTSFKNGNMIMSFPGEKDVFPEESVAVQKHFPQLFNGIRTNLISKFQELKITDEELLLLSVIICSGPVGTSPDGSELSDNGKKLMERYYNMHCSILFDYCLRKDQGPTRLGELLSVITEVTKTMEDLAKTLTLFSLNEVPMEKLIKDFF